MLVKSLLISLFLVAGSAWGAVLDGKSAHRDPGTSYEAYKTKAWLMSQGRQPQQDSRTPVDVAIAYDKAVLPEATKWNSQAEMLERFRKLRDIRFLVDSSKPDFLRRSTWLYPDDGCFARAALAVRNLFKWTNPAPSKVFVFGNLNVQTSNSPYGSVTWWYHVAPLVQVDGEKYVLDPAIEPRQPLKLNDWLARMSQSPGQLEVAVCGSGSYTPYDPCARDTDGKEEMAETDQQYFLGAEWERLESLNRKPEEELGDNPPWLR